MARSAGLVTMTSGMTEPVVVDTQSAWYSKINWTQVVALIAMLGTTFNLFDLTPEMQASILSGIIALQSVITVILKTFFTTTVTPVVVQSSENVVPLEDAAKKK